MERLGIDEIIEHCKRKTTKYEHLNGIKKLENADLSNTFIKEYWEHRQVGEYLQELKEYRDLEEQGKLVRLPCKTGDTLYFPYIDTITKEGVISEEEVTEIGLYYRVGNGELSSCSEIGSIIFLTKSEAEEALKKINEMEGENG